MSESLTNEQLDDLEKMVATHWLDDFLTDDYVLTLISMARRFLSAEERLERAVEAIEDAMMHLRTNIDIDGNKMDESDAFRSLDKFLMSHLGTPKELRPPQECAPSAETDALRDEESDHSLEAMRKELDDHSCNTTGWEK